MRYEPHYRAGDDQRVSGALGHAMGSIAHAQSEQTAERCLEALACLYDHKGDLHVVRKSGATWDEAWEVAFRKAWEFYCECAENVFFQYEGSNEWAGIWSSRRFEVEEP